MMVYGDPQFEAPLGTVISRLRKRAVDTCPTCLDEIRSLLIQIGQLEQGIQDYCRVPNRVDPDFAKQISQITDIAAALFFQVWNLASNALVRNTIVPRNALSEIIVKLEALNLKDDPVINIKVPEGFEFYALFPEQYCVSALKWAIEHDSAAPKRAVIVGIRSIGTTLSALVMASLHAAGWEIKRFTVRPTGHPFARVVQ